MHRTLIPLSFLASVCLLFYSWALHTLSLEEEVLRTKCTSLEHKLASVENQNTLLREKLCSVRDPSGEEYMLRNYLGLCPRTGLQIRIEEKNCE